MCIRDRSISKCFSRTALVSLDHNAQSSLLAFGGSAHEIFERDDVLGCATRLGFAIETLAGLRNLTRFHRILDNDELVARHRHAPDTEDLNRNSRACFLHGLATLIEKRAHSTRVHAADEVVSDFQSAG